MSNRMALQRTKSVKFSPTTSVRFCSDMLPANEMTNADRDRIWYSPRQLEGMKNEVRVQSREFRLLRENQKTKNTIIPSYNSNKSHTVRRVSITNKDDISYAGPITDYDSPFDEDTLLIPTSSDTDSSFTVCSRGLEQRVCLERQKNKIIALRAVIEYHQRLKQKNEQNQNHGTESNHHIDSATKLAIISSKCTRWARDVAVICGKNDFEQAYPELALSQNKLNINKMHINKIRPFPNIFIKRAKEDTIVGRSAKRRHSLPQSLPSMKPESFCEMETTHAIPT